MALDITLPDWGLGQMAVNWTERMSQFLRDNYQRMEDKEISKFLSSVTGQRVDVRSIENRRATMGLIKYRLNAGEPIGSAEVVAPEVRAAWEQAHRVGGSET